jgi:serine/threonine-protein kinase RsbW
MKEVKIKIPSSTEFIGPVVKFCYALFTDRDLEESVVSNVVTSVIEALSNAITHGNRSDITKNIDISIQVNKNRLNIKVRDEGIGFDINSLPDPLAPENLLKPYGRGIFFIKSFMDDVTFHVNKKSSTLVMKKVFEHNIE